MAYEAAQKEIESLKAQIAALKIHKFGLECFSSDNFIFKFYTGFLGYKHFYNFYHFVEPSAQHILMSCFYFLVRIRLGLFAQDLADRFSIITSTVSRKITTQANYLYFLLSFNLNCIHHIKVTEYHSERTYWYCFSWCSCICILTLHRFHIRQGNCSLL